MKKYNLAVCVMQDNEPIMFIYSKDFDEYAESFLGRVPHKWDVFAQLKKAFPSMDWVLQNGHESSGQGTTDYCEYTCSPDAERDDMELLAIWQEI